MLLSNQDLASYLTSNAVLQWRGQGEGLPGKPLRQVGFKIGKRHE